MTTVERVDGTLLSHEERVQLYVDILHVGADEAEAMIAIEDGVVNGDVIALEDDAVPNDEDEDEDDAETS